MRNPHAILLLGLDRICSHGVGCRYLIGEQYTRVIWLTSTYSNTSGSMIPAYSLRRGTCHLTAFPYYFPTYRTGARCRTYLYDSPTVLRSFIHFPDSPEASSRNETCIHQSQGGDPNHHHLRKCTEGTALSCFSFSPIMLALVIMLSSPGSKVHHCGAVAGPYLG